MWVEIIQNNKSTLVNLSMASFVEEVSFSKKLIIANGQHSQCFDCGTLEKRAVLLNTLRECVQNDSNGLKQIII